MKDHEARKASKNPLDFPDWAACSMYKFRIEGVHSKGSNSLPLQNVRKPFIPEECVFHVDIEYASTLALNKLSTSAAASWNSRSNAGVLMMWLAWSPSTFSPNSIICDLSSSNIKIKQPKFYLPYKVRSKTCGTICPSSKNIFSL